jgi:integrase
MLFKVYSRFVPNLTRRDGSAFERLLTGAIGNQKQQPQLETNLPSETEVSHV